ncbi:MAG: hypothetical protein WBC93_15930 [Sulfitobacter sp.]
MADKWAGTSTGITGPARGGAAVTPNDSADLPTSARGIYVGGAGNVALVTTDGDTLTFAGAAAGATLPICTARVLATGTTATNLLALW